MKTMIEYNRNLVLAKVRQCFPREDPEKVMTLLDLYGKESYEQERERVQIAIIKLSQGDLDKLRENVKAAKNDFRDVLAYVEYPEEMKKETWKMKDQEEASRIRERDRKQYLDWLNR
jgi:hypothetical protein